jgi:hypothetical protein
MHERAAEIAAVVFLAATMWAGCEAIGLPPAVIVGGSGVAERTRHACAN